MEKMKDFIDWVEFGAPAWVAAFVGLVVFTIGALALLAYVFLVMTFPPTLPLTLAALTYMTWSEYQKDKRK